jgi:hypothetical protein
METSAVQTIKLMVVSFTGLEKDALHIYIGLSVFLGFAAVFRQPLRAPGPWLAVLVVAVCGELLDLRDDLASLGHWRWKTSLHDILNTLFWPTVLFVLARCSGLLNGQPYPNGPRSSP